MSFARTDLRVRGILSGKHVDEQDEFKHAEIHRGKGLPMAKTDDLPVLADNFVLNVGPRILRACISGLLRINWLR